MTVELVGNFKNIPEKYRILFYGRVANLFTTLRGTANFTANYTTNVNSDNDNVQQLSSQELFESIVINLYPNKVHYF